MCTELILAFIYFIAIALVNYFVFKILKTNLESISFLLKLFFIFSNFNKTETKSIFFHLLKLKKSEKQNILLNYLNEVLITSDILLIGYTYKFLSTNFSFNLFPFFSYSEKNKLKEKKELIVSNKLYFNLLKTQYLLE